MTRVSIRHGGLLKCAGKTLDSKPCPVRFHTYSIFRLTRTQAKAAGWTRQVAWHITGNREDGLNKADACPQHTQIAEMNKSRRKELVAAELAARRAGRAQEAAEKTAAWAKRQQQWAEARAAKAARKQERADKRAAKANADSTKAAARAARAKERFDAKHPPPPPAKHETPATDPDPAAKKPRRKPASRAERQADAKAFAEQIDKHPKRQTTLPTESEDT